MSDRSVLHVLPHPGGGGEVYVDQMGRIPGYTHERFYLTPHGSMSGAGRRVPELRRRATEFDLMHVHGDASAILSVPALRKTRSVISTHGLHLARRVTPAGRVMVKQGLRSAVARAVITICTSESERDDLESYGADPERLITVPNAVEIPPPVTLKERTAQRRSLGLDENKLVAFLVGSLEPTKDPLTFLRGIYDANSHDAGVIGVMVGAGSLSDEVLLASRQAPDELLLLGQRDDVGALLAAGDVIAMCSDREGMSLALLEGMANGLAPVVSDIPGNAEPVGSSGLLFALGDYEGLSEQLVRLAGDRELLARFGQEARLRVETEYGLDRMLETTAKVYETALAPAG